MILTTLRLSIFILSLYGYAALFAFRLGFHKQMSWIASICAQILILYAGAYLGFLPITGWVLFAVGMILSLYYFIKERRYRFFEINFVTIGMTVYFVVFAGTLLQTYLEHYDNYSHWAIIVKFLYTEGRLPTATDSIISFTSYPLGSSLFVYYTTLIAGFSDQIMLVGQFILIISSLYALFVILRDRRRRLITAMMFTFFAVFNHFNIAIRINNLLVDYLLAVLTLAGIAGLFHLQKDSKRMAWYLVLIVGTLSMIKNSALFFVGVLFLYYLYLLIKNRKQSKNHSRYFGIGVAALVASMLPFLTWLAHVRSNFPQSKHEVSLSAYQQMFEQKDYAILEQITDLYVSTITDFSILSTQGILLVNVLFIGGYLIIRWGFNRKNTLLRYAVATNAMIIAYYFGIYLMFLFSMPTEEALYLAGFERYASTIVILALGICMLVLAREIDYTFYEPIVVKRNYRSYKNIRTKKIYQYTTLFLIFVATLLFLSENNGMRYNNANFADSVPARFSQVVGNEMKLNEQRYLVVTTNKEAVENYQVGFVGTYFLYSPHVFGREDFVMDQEPFIALLEEYDKIVVLEEHFTFNAMMEQSFETSLQPGVYEVAEIVNQTLTTE